MTATRRLAAILAADVAGYSRLIGIDEEGTLARLRLLRRELIDPQIDAHHGRIVKTTGDGILIEFASVVDAVRCAVAVQRGMVVHEAELSEERRIAFRVGINLGDIVVEGHDILGDGVNIAARLEGIAEPGGICISASAWEQARGKIEAEVADLGEQSLRNIARPVRAYRVLLEPPPVAQPEALPLPDKPSIAVLPFQNLSGDPEQGYFADGMVEDITTGLSKIRWFFVIARNSSFTYKGRAVDVKQVSRELGVRYVLEGSVRKSGNRLRITAQLIDAATGNHVWAERYDRDIADIFAVQDEITERVVAAIEPELYAAENIRSQRKTPESLDAWECVIRALTCVGQGTIAGNTEAEVFCRRAITIAPDYGQAHSVLAWVLWRRAAWLGGTRNILAEAMVEARTALRLDERDPWAHFALGTVLLRMRQPAEAERAFRRALELNPNFALAHAYLGTPLAFRGAHEEAVASAEHALRLSPSDRLVGAYGSVNMANAHFAAEHYADAVAWARKTLEYSEFIGAYSMLIAAAALQGEMAAAAAALADVLSLQPDFSLAWMSDYGAGERLLEGLRRAGVPEK